MSEINVAVGGIVKKGTQIALSGNTGTTTATALGLKVALYNRVINPKEIICFDIAEQEVLK